MLIIGRGPSHVIAPKVRPPIAAFDKREIQSRAVKQVEAGAQVLDLTSSPEEGAPPGDGVIVDRRPGGHAGRPALAGHDAHGGDRSRAEAMPAGRDHQQPPTRLPTASPR